MQTDNSSIIYSVYRAIDALNQTLPTEKRLEKSPDTALLGQQGALDSLGMVNLVVETEMAIEEDFGRSINLADQNAAAQGAQVYETVATFTSYIETLLNNN